MPVVEGDRFGLGVTVGVGLAMAVCVGVGRERVLVAGGRVGDAVDPETDGTHDAPMIAVASEIDPNLVGRFSIQGNRVVKSPDGLPSTHGCPDLF